MSYNNINKFVQLSSTLNNTTRNNYKFVWLILLQHLSSEISMPDRDYSKSSNMSPEPKSKSMLSVDGRFSSTLRALLFTCSFGAWFEQPTSGAASDARLKCASYLVSPTGLTSFKDFWYKANRCLSVWQFLAKCEKSTHLWHLLSFLGFALSLFLLYELGLYLLLCLHLPDLFFGNFPLNLFLGLFCTLWTLGRGTEPIGRLWWFFIRSSSCFSV